MVEATAGLSQSLQQVSNNNELTASQKDTTVLSSNFDTFLKILTAQLKSQDPLDPLDASSFTNQLVEFSNVEQSILSNKHLEKISNNLDKQNAADFVSYLGKKATVETNTAIKSDNYAAWSINAEADSQAKINIIDSQGKIVYTLETNLIQGQQNFRWDGRNNNQIELPDGQYQISINAFDEQNQPVRTTAAIKGIISAIDLTGTEPYVLIDNKRILLKAVSRLEI